MTEEINPYQMPQEASNQDSENAAITLSRMLWAVIYRVCLALGVVFVLGFVLLFFMPIARPSMATLNQLRAEAAAENVNVEDVNAAPTHSGVQ